MGTCCIACTYFCCIFFLVAESAIHPRIILPIYSNSVFCKFENYLYVIAKNKCKDFWKKKQPIYLESLDKEISNQELSDIENKMFIKEALTP